MRRTLLVAVLLALVAPVLAQAGPTASAAASAVTGTVTSRDKVALSPAAVTIVTLVDQQAGANSTVVIGQQSITGGQFPIAFSVPYGTIDTTHSYALFASTLDAGTTRQTFEAVPAITGGPTTGLALPVILMPATPAATVTGTITKTDKTALTGAAVAYAILVDSNTNTMIARQVIPAPGATPISFQIGYDPGIIDPAATYVVKAAIVDTGKAWEGRTGVPAVTNGAPSAGVQVPVAITAAPPPTPAPTAKPTAAPTAKPTAAPTAKPTPKPTAAPTAKPTAAPTAKPTAAPTAKPTPTASPTPNPTAAPTASPTPEPTAAPTASPTAAPTAVPTATPTVAPTASPTAAPAASPSVTASATASPTPAPTTGTIKGTLTWREQHQLSAEAHAVVLLVEGSAGPDAGTIIASTRMTDPGQQPVPWQLAYPFSSLVQGESYRLYAGIVDGDLAWVTPIGVPVKTGVPLVTGVELPLAFRPDLLKGAVTGTITGVGLDSARGPGAYGTALVIRVSTGETIGFQLIEPAGAAPVPYSVPYDPTTIDPNSDYVARGSIWDGTTQWETPVGVPVLTKGNARTDVQLTVTPAPTPPPTPTPEPTATPAPTVAATPAPEVPAESGGGVGWIWIVLLVIGAIAVGVVVMRSRAKAELGSPRAVRTAVREPPGIASRR
jgi:uncharacterized lipoprotein YbaY